MARERLYNVPTDPEMELEIELLKESEFVHLAQKEIRLKARMRKYLYQLRWLEKHGKELAASGYTLDNIEERLFGDMTEAIDDDL